MILSGAKDKHGVGIKHGDIVIREGVRCIAKYQKLGLYWYTEWEKPSVCGAYPTTFDSLDAREMEVIGSTLQEVDNEGEKI